MIRLDLTDAQAVDLLQILGMARSSITTGKWSVLDGTRVTVDEVRALVLAAMVEPLRHAAAKAGKSA